MIKNKNILRKLQQIIHTYSDLPDVFLSDAIDEELIKIPVAGQFRIKSHDPLNVIKYSFRKDNRFWTCNYLLELEVAIVTKQKYKGKIYLQRGYGEFFLKSTNVNLKCMADLLRGNKYLMKIMNQLDIERFEIFFDGHMGKVRLTPYAGTCIRMLIPPVTYVILPEKQECILTLQALQIACAILM